jgi:ATP-dependent Clp protease adaptor protein ClpS
MTTTTINRVESKNEINNDFINPKMYKVVFLNDDVTTFDFVIYLLEFLFNKTKSEAIELTLKIHNEGKGVAGIFYKEIAEQKRIQSIYLARKNGFPLNVELEST